MDKTNEQAKNAFFTKPVAVMAEECIDTGDCNHVTCPENDYTLHCVHHQCTCTHGKYVSSPLAVSWVDIFQYYLVRI